MAFVGVCYGPTPNGYYETQWLATVTAFGVDQAWQREPELSAAAQQCGVLSCVNAEDLPEEYTLVVMSPQTAREVHPVTSLHDFVHPENAVYFFGSDTTWLSSVELGGRVPDHIVYVPVISSNESDELYSFVIAGIVLSDRMRQRG